MVDWSVNARVSLGRDLVKNAESLTAQLPEYIEQSCAANQSTCPGLSSKCGINFLLSRTVTFGDFIFTISWAFLINISSKK